MSRVIVIGHRGASGERPEHTLESYRLAIEEGADFVEPDLVMTKDGVLIARHEPEIGGTTNVADLPQFASRRRSQVIDGEKMDGWFTEDFTLAEIKTLRARERLPQIRPANVAFNDKFEVPTFEEILQLVAKENRDRRGAVGVYPETKHPEHFRQLGLPQEALLLKVLDRHGYSRPGSRVFIQSFDPSNLRMLRGMTKLPLVQLLEHELGDLKVIAGYADAIGIRKPLATAEGVRAAHAAKLTVHVWTFRAENEFLPQEFRVGASMSARGKLTEEIDRYLARGIDGLFTDHPAIGVRARNAWAQKNIEI
jgi:glycerophosphoryl diester phosphodiesterase